MASKFAGDIIAGGFARGLNVGTTARQTFAERLGVQLAQRQRDLSYQNFQNLQQRNRQTFMKEQQLKRLGQQEEQFMMSHQLAQDVEGRQIAENVTAAKRWNAQFGLQKEAHELDKFKNNIGFFDDQIRYAVNEMSRIDPLTQPDLYAQARQQYVMGLKGRDAVIKQGGVPKGYGPAINTLKAQAEGYEAARQDKIQAVRRKQTTLEHMRKLGMTFPGGAPMAPEKIDEIQSQGLVPAGFEPKGLQQRGYGVVGGFDPRIEKIQSETEQVRRPEDKTFGQLLFEEVFPDAFSTQRKQMKDAFLNRTGK